MDLELAGKRALVTGATKGIGRAIVEGLLAEGVSVAFCARSAESVKIAESELSTIGPNVVGTAFDVADLDALKNWVDTSAEQLGGIDIVVSNVSAMAGGEFPDVWRKHLDTDIMGMVGLVEAALAHLEKSASGNIVTIASVSGREVDLFPMYAYGAVKAATVHYTSMLGYHLAGKGIRANTVSPGDTYYEGSAWDQLKIDAPEELAAMQAINPTGRMAETKEIANAVVFLASGAASYVNGAHLVVDGALTRGVQL
jgi:3-oxoacyl-[acyl-carrier protein] reductase